MGDECSIYVTCRKRDARRFAKFGLQSNDGEFVPEVDAVGIVAIGNHDTNQPVEDFQSIPVPFLGSHSEGWEYGPAYFAFDGTEWAYCVGTNDHPVVECDPDTGAPRPDSLKAFLHYVEVRRRVREAWGCPTPGSVAVWTIDERDNPKGGADGERVPACR